MPPFRRRKENLVFVIEKTIDFIKVIIIMSLEKVIARREIVIKIPLRPV